MNLHKPRLLFSILLFAGILLAALSGTDLCNFDGCTTVHQYRFFGIHLAVVGLTYFGLLTVALIATKRYKGAVSLLSLLLAGGAGAELAMIYLQKIVIQAWCPLCLGIAAVVYLLCTLQTRVEYRRLVPMKRRQILAKFLLMLTAIVTGFIVSFIGIDLPEAASTLPETALGKQGSTVEVYVFSDWLCPVCVKVEPAIESAFPQMEKKARIFFIDKPVHKEAMNFVPYHLSFLVNEKGKYLQLRRALFNLAKKTKSPTIDDVKVEIAPLGVTYKQLSFMDVTQIMGKSQSLATRFKVSGTPTVVITNSLTKKAKTLVGNSDITRENLLKAVKSLE
jgi:uncharacterized membrane protein